MRRRVSYNGSCVHVAATKELRVSFSMSSATNVSLLGAAWGAAPSSLLSKGRSLQRSDAYRGMSATIVHRYLASRRAMVFCSPPGGDIAQGCSGPFSQWGALLDTLSLRNSWVYGEWSLAVLMRR